MNTHSGYSTDTSAMTRSLPRVSWGAIVAGAIMALAVQAVLSLLAAGVGLSAADPLHYNSPDASTYGMGAAIWWALSSIVSLFAGGWVAGHLAGAPTRVDAALHGLVTWGVATLFAAYIVTTSITSLVKGGANVVTAAGTAAASGIASAAGPAKNAIEEQLRANGFSMDGLKSQAQQLVVQTGQPAQQGNAQKNQGSSTDQHPRSENGNGSSPQAQGKDLERVVERIFASGSDTVPQADKQTLVDIVIAQSGMARPEAEQRVDQWAAAYSQTRAKLNQAKAQAEAKAREVAQKAAAATALAALGAVLALLLGALAAGLGGSLSGRRYVGEQTAWKD